MEPGRALRDAGWAALLVLFAASLLTVLGWLLQSARGWWRRGAPGGRTPGPAPAAEPAGPLRELGVWRSLLRLRAAPAGAPGEPGVRGLLASLFAFKSFRENWQRAWVRALNEQACRAGVSLAGLPGVPSLSLSFPGRDRSLPGAPDGAGISGGAPGLPSSLGSEKRVQVRLEAVESRLGPRFSVPVVGIPWLQLRSKLLFS